MLQWKDFWKTAPSGGEFTSLLEMEENGIDLATTVELIREAHTTFLGPEGSSAGVPGRIPGSSEKYGLQDLDSSADKRKEKARL